MRVSATAPLTKDGVLTWDRVTALQEAAEAEGTVCATFGEEAWWVTDASIGQLVVLDFVEVTVDEAPRRLRLAVMDTVSEEDFVLTENGREQR